MIDDDRNSLEAKLKEVRAALKAMHPGLNATSSAVNPAFGLPVTGVNPVDPGATGPTEELRLQLESEERELEETLRAS